MSTQVLRAGKGATHAPTCFIPLGRWPTLDWKRIDVAKVQSDVPRCRFCGGGR